MSQVYLRNISGIYQTYLMSISYIIHTTGICHANFSHVLGISQAYKGLISGLSQISCIYKSYLDHISGMYKIFIKHIQGSSQAYCRHISGIFQAYIALALISFYFILFCFRKWVSGQKTDSSVCRVASQLITVFDISLLFKDTEIFAACAGFVLSCGVFWVGWSWYVWFGCIGSSWYIWVC